MLVAHLIPGYFAATKSKPAWKPEWNTGQRILLWTAALVSTVIPDLDVIYNALFRGFFNHSTLWTHSLFPHLAVTLLWWMLRRFGRWPYLQTLVGLVAIGGLSHLLLDALARGTTIFYPLSTEMVGTLNARVMQGGVWGYLTDPIFLLEPLLLTIAAAHWVWYHLSSRIRLLALILLMIGLVAFIMTFLMLLPDLQAAIP